MRGRSQPTPTGWAGGLCCPAGYDACHNTDEVLAAAGYDPDADTDNPADSVFCSHGAGYLVKWDEVPARAHVSSGLERRLGTAPAAGQTQEEDEANARRRRASAYCGTLEQDKELLAIFERTYGKIKRRGGVDDAKKAARAALHTTPGGERAGCACARRAGLSAGGRLQCHLCVGRPAQAGGRQP